MCYYPNRMWIQVCNPPSSIIIIYLAIILPSQGGGGREGSSKHVIVAANQSVPIEQIEMIGATEW